MKRAMFVLLLTTIPAWVCADTICRQPDQADFGTAVSSYGENAFVITGGCEEPRLEVRKPLPLTLVLGPSRPADTAAWTVLFAYGRADLDEHARLVLNLIPPGSRARVTGHACPLGSEGYNLSLSQRRAEAAAAYLRGRGVKVAAVVGKGECCPVSKTDLQQNRRVEIEEDRP